MHMHTTSREGKMSSKKIYLTEDAIPKQWYSILPDLPKPMPPIIDPETHAPGPGIVPRLFPKAILEQEMSTSRWIPIPDEVREIYRLWRPTPLIRATRLEHALKTPAKIYFKYEGVSPAGSHKPNTAVAQAFYNMKEGKERMATETGAGQWGSALAFGCQVFDLKATVYMVRISYDQKPYRRVMMETWGADVYPSPSPQTAAGRSILAANPESTGSLGIAISEAIDDALENTDANYGIGSVFNHVLIHQSVIGLEAQQQLAQVDEYPDSVFGCIGGGSSFSGLFWPFYHDNVAKKAPKPTRFIAAEATACPSVTRGLRYHGMAPSLCLLAAEHQVETCAYDQVSVFDAARLFANTEGIIPAPEPAHAIKGAIDEAIRCRETGEEKTILFLLCGHGYFDMQAYDDYLHGNLLPYEYPAEKVHEAMTRLRALYPWLDQLPY
jgi:tryptophan synthase beta chain